ncbi:transcription factor bHLH118-like [Nicotiana tabacum]|uniref:Transcription factor bHLH118-like n=3 Tax=Nicotiana TaxID=4085 RepID=A0AC58S8R3_TOBAC|nr:PREDICTED: transcription factor bHLH118-like [Nicotiana sylvestris]XP_009804989.1 PREDICTED: transcription factor bHLH118-like [Nicotiana sylvestris]XP_016452590.1 PREDICTED: transcription factor bHLH118-like [Nicotiana tabacum]
MMDNFHSIFPLQQDVDDNDSHELLYNNPCNFLYQQDLVTDFAPLESDKNTLSFNNNQKENKVGKASAASLPVEKTSDDKQKKVMHREIERQRRQEMATLYASLRQQLPLEIIKGKRSTSEHILEAANYIEYLQKNVRNLEDKREKLNKTSNSSNLDYTKSGRSSTSDSSSSTNVTVKQCLDGMEILVNCGVESEGFRLSRVLEVLLQEGLNIVNCSCTKTSTSLLHTIRTEVASQARIDVHVIQQKLSDISFS